MKNGRYFRKFVFVLLLALGSLVVTAYASAGGSSETTAGSKNTAGGSAGTTGDPGGTPPAGYRPYDGSDKIVGTTDQGAKTVVFDIIGAQRNSSNSFNFNGYSSGDMAIEIPEGWKVTVNFTVQGSLAHSAIIVPWSQRQASTFTSAFPGSAIPDYTSGITSSDPPAAFTFTASTPGKYAIVCAVPGHDDLGMWDEVDVVRGLAQPEVLVK